MAAELLIEQGHRVVLHARSEQRGAEAMAALPGAETVVIGDLSSIKQTRSVAVQVNRLGSFDGVIHNAAVGYREPRRISTEDGLAHVFAVNTLAPYLLTALIQRPKRLVYLGSGLHKSGDATLDDLNWEHRPWQGQQAYSDTKLHDVMLAFAVARLWPEVLSNAVEPAGWRRRWAALEPRMILLPPIAPRCGWWRATTPPRKLRESTSIIFGYARQIPPPVMWNGSRNCWRRASGSPAWSCRQVDALRHRPLPGA
jgi:NAD(P)-dependent dehydrogenase (short-subunit alcohol dehydrogenase family)